MAILGEFFRPFMFFKTIGLINQQVNILDKKYDKSENILFLSKVFWFLAIGLYSSDCPESRHPTER